ncbi:ATP-binding protein [Cryptosporangium minutisporangium]|uniref:histidine kinase n=1 Tax=Cryptosporangium minutisporangium TaxID=113569 RepID=A0ABP6ST29_9ACTN
MSTTGSGEATDIAALTAEVEALRAELDETSRGLMALYAELSTQTEELERARLAAEEATRAKAAFLADMGHEIRNPLNSVIGFAELLDETELTPEQADYLKPIRAAGDHLRSLMDDLLDFSKLEAGHFTFEAIPFDVVGCVEDALAIVAPQAAAKQLSLAAVFTPDTPTTASGDPTRLRQILVNLLVNAVKFTAEGQVWVELAVVRTGPDRASLSFAVHDTGIGISPDALERIFVPFAQADASTTRRYGGTGLGLSIARELSERMDGELTVASEFGVGSTFTSTVCLDVSAETLADPDDQPLSGRTVLLVHDDPVAERALRVHLTGWGAVVRTEPGPVDPVLAVVGAGSEPLLGLGPAVPVVVLAPLSVRRQTYDGVAAVLYSPVRRSQLRAAVNAALTTVTDSRPA